MAIALEPNVSNGVVVPEVIGNRLSVICFLKFSGEYKTGGDSSLAKTLEAYFKEIGKGTITWVQVTGTPGYIYMYNFETSKLQVFDSGKEKEALAELKEEEYPKKIRTESKPKLFAVGN